VIEMAERALLARQREDYWYECYRARWGGTDRALGATFGGINPADLPSTDWEFSERAPFRAIVENLDYLAMSALYRETRDGLTVFVPLWFGLLLDDKKLPSTAGALLSVSSLPDARGVRDWFREIKGTLADVVRAGRLSRYGAISMLQDIISRIPDRERHVSRAR
jgi:hypothetical protein